MICHIISHLLQFLASTNMDSCNDDLHVPSPSSWNSYTILVMPRTVASKVTSPIQTLQRPSVDVSHSCLLLKLHHYGIYDQLHELFKDYLSNQVQCIILQGVISSPLPVLSGVPQSSILCPVLFLVYIIDLPCY